MQQQDARKSWSDQRLYIGIDVSTVNWQICILSAYREERLFVQDPRPELLLAYVEREFPGGAYHACYEAGYHGYWIADALRAHPKMTVIVVNPADVPTMDAERVRKTDRVDARKLARELRSGTLRAIYTPTIEERCNRGIVRRRQSAVRDRARVKTRIRSFLAFHGIQEPTDVQPWTQAYIAWLRTVALPWPSARMELDSRLQELHAYDAIVATVQRQVLALRRSERYAATMDILTSAPGIGPIVGMTIASELASIERFASEAESASYVGLVPGEHSSGSRTRTTGIIRRHNRFLRMMLIEASWRAIRKDASLDAVYRRALKRGLPAQKAIVVVARTLWRRTDYCWRHHQPYVTPTRH